MTVKTYDIQELVTQSGVPRRTIYFYVQQGILPPPEGAGLAAHYNEDHLLRLQLIPVLRRQGLRLDEIRARFAQMGMEAMRKLKQQQLQEQQQLQGSQTRPAATRSIREPAPGVMPMPGVSVTPGVPVTPDVPGPLTGWGEQHFTHYALPAGIALVAPEILSAIDRQRLQQLLQAARQIFSGSPFYLMDSGQKPAASNGPGGSHSPEEE